MGGNDLFFYGVGSKVYGVRCLLIALVIVLPLVLQATPSADQTLSGLNIEQFEERTDEPVSWTNNPFVQPADDVAVSELKLTGIVYSPEDSAAIINDTVVRLDDKIGYNEVVGIEKSAVVLRNENGIFRLSLKGGGS